MSRIQTQAILIFKRFLDVFARECLKIQTKAGTLVPFVFNRVQRKLWLLLQEDLKAGKPIRWSILKARQMGVSTFIAALFYWIASFHAHKGCLVVAHDADSAQGLFEKQKMFYKASPQEVRPMRKLDNRMILHFANPDSDGTLGLESKIGVDTAANKNLGASFTIQAVHLSERARYEDVNPQWAASVIALNQAIPELPGTFVIKETTGQGEGPFKDEWDDEDSNERKIFLSFVAEDEYRLELEPDEYFRLSDVADTLYGDEEEQAEYIRAQVVYWFPEWEARTPENIKRIEHEVMCRLAWRRWYIVNKCKRDKNAFAQEYPLTPEQAFVATGSSVFDAKELSDRRKQLRERDKANETEGITYPVRYRFAMKASDDRKADPNWWQRAFYEAGYGPLSIYEDSIPGRRYVIGADVCEGIQDGDDSGACVLKCPDLIQVASFRGNIDTDTYADILFALGRIYNGALLGVEVNSVGKATVMRLQRLRYRPLYMRESLVHADVSKRVAAYGWRTTETTKPMLIGDLKGALRDDEITLLDITTIEQLMTYKKLPDGTLGAAPGKKDDLVIGVGIAVQMARQVNIPKSSQPKIYPRGSMGHALRELERHAGRGLRK